MTKKAGPLHGLVVQTLAIYDRFGRLMLGGEEQPKDVLEYLVLERHLVNPYGRWRLHGKIVPSWAPAKEPVIKVMLRPFHSFKNLLRSANMEVQHKLLCQTKSFKKAGLCFCLSLLVSPLLTHPFVLSVFTV